MWKIGYRAAAWLTPDRSLRLLVIAMMLVTAAIYQHYGEYRNRHNGQGYFPMLGQAFLSGHTYVGVGTHSVVWDSSLYKGKQYLYFGPVPTLLPWIPVYWLTGINLGDGQLLFFYSALGSCYLIWLVTEMAQKASLPRWALLLIIAPVCFGTWIPLLLTFEDGHNVAIAGAYCFTSLGFLCLWQGCAASSKPTIFWKLGSSLSFGLAAGCRLIYAVDVLALCTIWLYGAHRRTLRDNMREAIILATPWILCLAGLAAYNYARFGSFFETGYTYQLSGNSLHYNRLYYSHSNFPDWQWQYIPARVHAYLLRPLPLSKLLPWSSNFGVTRVSGMFGTEGYAYGLWRNSPFSLWSLWFLLNLRRCRKIFGNTYSVIVAVIPVALGLTLLLGSYLYITTRYMVDFAPWIMLLAALGYIQALHASSGRWRVAVIIAGSIMALWSTYVGLANCYCGCSPYGN